jgi:uncharacterized protein (TIGR03382 family)
MMGWRLAAVAAIYTVGAVYGLDYYGSHLRPTTRTRTDVVRLTPHSRQYGAVTVTLTERSTTRGHSGVTSDVARRDVAIDLENGPFRATFVRDALGGANLYRDASGAERKTAAPFTDEFRSWVADHKVDVSNPAVAAELDTLATAVAQAGTERALWDALTNRSDRYFTRLSSARYTDPSGSGFYYEGAIGVTIVVGLALLALVWLRYRRRLSDALAAAAAPGPARAAPGETLAAGGDVGSRLATARTLSVMFSDVKDYTARAARESRLGVLDLVRRHRDLARPIVKRRGGRVVKSLGDGLLITFESATDAVLAGLEIQAAAAAHSRDAFADRDKLELRIAVSTGEVAVDGGGDVFGDAVNLASRAQQQASPGEVLFTEATWATINRREVRGADAGMFELKGVAEPVRLYRAGAMAADAGAAAPVESDGTE